VSGLIVVAFVVASLNFAADGDPGGPQQGGPFTPPSTTSTIKQRTCFKSGVQCAGLLTGCIANNQTCVIDGKNVPCGYYKMVTNNPWGLCTQTSSEDCDYDDKKWCCQSELTLDSDCNDVQCYFWYYRVNACSP
jgi:hypothetical protein